MLSLKEIIMPLIEFDSTSMLFFHPTKPVFLGLLEFVYEVEFFPSKLLQLHIIQLYHPKNHVYKLFFILNCRHFPNWSQIYLMLVFFLVLQMELFVDVAPFQLSCTLHLNNFTCVFL